ncbi:hypothetical protein [Mesorhizobium sp. M4B.F.Ca.ET.058.02.1.1]|uniref:hypothetical protein n=1 Tax=Mesorhizobium sp. M4B.F.Ca.ET.058.02.1.1 TaxID=2493675 RepID=UPI000F75E3CD|nr:hypothetical protein [Mesorhizobium sp. M4B.F.Ca.ET.058.02.1.1]AZO49920.1 hypothetical protein EJ073_20520 [Mesorhizobium sp. M4B.F.Ca.ET.058.02.1.1]TJX55784.1 MAG: hypothetical protein E5W21_16070 [Mesorhizobium sp.]
MFFSLEEISEQVVRASCPAPHSDSDIIQVAAAHAGKYLPDILFGISKASERRDERGVRGK